MKIRYMLYAFSALMVFAFVGCDDDPEQKFNSTYPVAGEWIVDEYVDGAHAWGPYHLQIFNTANSTDSVWISNIFDDGVFIKALVNPDKTFVADESPDLSEGYAYATITDGRIINTDSIHFNVALYVWDGDDAV